MMSIADNYRMISNNVKEAAVKSGRGADDVTLVAVTKFVDKDRILQAIEAGADNVGENRVQEFVDKEEFFKNYKINTHFIGQLQTNKVKYVLGKVKLVQSVDRLALAKELSRVATLRGLSQDILIEVNIGREEQKGGVMPEQLCELLSQIQELPGIFVKGLMCVPPAVGEREVHAYFAQMRKLFDDVAAMRIENVSMDVLSMGMSSDYMAAIAEGSTMVRVGSALFGARAKI
ncbi:MAG: YggS family pyridoxal phosphate-dependent enzyme [Clostridia bacterium]|nr:YggS family pyridoxal phosphate-dependent enzyme [Clostridia bacterium]